MLFTKTNKNKQNNPEKAEGISWLSSTPEARNQLFTHSIMLNVTLQHNNRILKMRRNSNFSEKLVNNSYFETTTPIKAIYAKKIPLCEYNKERGKHKSCRSVNQNYEKPSYRESNFDLLKQQARKLDDDGSACNYYRCRPHTSAKTHSYEQKNDQNSSLISESVKKSRKCNMRKIIKGRPQIKKLLQQNRERIFRAKNIEHADFIIGNVSTRQTKASIDSQAGDRFQGTLHTIL